MRIAFLFFLILFPSLIQAQSDAPPIDSLSALAAKSAEDSIRLRYELAVVDAYILSRDFETADSLLRPLVGQVKDQSNKRLLAELYFSKGRTGYHLHPVDSAIAWYKIADGLFEKLGSNYKQAKCKNSLGNLVRRSGDFTTAISFYQAGLEIAKKTDNKRLKTGFLANIGWLNFSTDMYEEALEYTHQAMRNYEEMEYPQGIAQMGQNLGAIYATIDSTKMGILYLEKALEQWKKLGATRQVAWVYSNLGGAYFYDKQYLKADTLFRESLKQFGQINDPYGRSSTLMNFGSNLNELQRYPEAAKALQEAYKLAKSLDYFDVYHKAQANLALAQYEIGEYDKAYQNRTQAAELKDSLRGEEVQDRITEIQEQYLAEQREKELAEKDLKLAEKDLKISQKNTVVVSLIGGLVAVLLFGFIFYSRKRAQQQAQLQEVIIQEQEKGLDAIISATESERKRIAKDLHDGVGQQLSALKMGFQQLLAQREMLQMQTQLEQLSELIDETARDTRSISHQMMPRALTELGLIPAIEGSLEKSLGNAGIPYEFEYFNLQERYAEQIEIAIYRILQELVNNIIKHAEATKASVQLFQNAQKLILMVEDNGKGIQATPSDGIGLLNIKNRLHSLQGNFHIAPGLEAGTSATITIPLSS